MKEESIFAEAVARESTGERNAYLDAACGDDAELRARIEALLTAHENPDSFLNPPDAGEPETEDYAPIGEGPGTVIGPYKLLEKIGEGGMGVVYMAEQTSPVKMRVALKIIKPGMDSKQVIARFETERQALALMEHPNIAKVLAAGTTESGRPYFAMELVKGEPITTYCDKHRLTLRERLRLFASVCSAVQHAHQKGIIHRDLKPSNVLIARYDGKPVAKVIDFGVAKATGQQLTEKTLFTRYGQVVGTLEYMSPEQAEFNQHDIDTRSDIYSLGILLYELLTGTTPFDPDRLRSGAWDEVMRIIREEEPPRPSVRVSSTEGTPSITAQNCNTEPGKLLALLRGDLDWLVMKTLEKERERRYETASALAADIERYLDGNAIEARPPSTLYRLRKTAARHRVALVTAAIVMLALIAGTVSSTWFAILRDAEARKAREAEQKALEQAETARKAKEELERALRRHWQTLADWAVDAVFSGDLEEARDAIRQARLAEAPPDLLQTLDGLALFFAGQNEEAIFELKKAAADNPNSLAALSALWWAYRNSADFSNMFRVEKTLKERKLQPQNRHEELFVCLILAVNRPTEKGDIVLERLNKLLQERKRWGAAHAIRATALQEHGLESKEVDDFRRAIEDFEEAEMLLGHSPFVLAIGLSILTDGIDLAEYQGSESDAQEWRRRGEEIAAKLREWPGHLKGGMELAVFYAATDQLERLRELEDELLRSGVGNRLLTQTSTAFPSCDMSMLDKGLKGKEQPEARICHAIVLAEMSKEDGEKREESLEIFRQLQKENMQVGLKTLALNIPLLLGMPGEAREASERLLASDVMSGEWRWFKYVTEYHAGQRRKDDLIQRAGPFSIPNCSVNFAIAMRSLAQGDRPRAREHFELTVKTGRIGSFNYHWAKAFLQRMEDEEAWPEWIRP